VLLPLGVVLVPDALRGQVKSPRKQLGVLPVALHAVTMKLQDMTDRPGRALLARRSQHGSTFQQTVHQVNTSPGQGMEETCQLPTRVFFVTVHESWWCSPNLAILHGAKLCSPPVGTAPQGAGGCEASVDGPGLINVMGSTCIQCVATAAPTSAQLLATVRHTALKRVLP